MSRKDRQPGDPQSHDKPGGAAGAGALTAAAAALDAELRRFEELAGAVRRAPLDSQKGIERAAGVVREAAESQTRFATLLHAMMDAMGGARDRMQTAADAINARADEIRDRSNAYTALVQRLGELGQEAKEIGVVAQAVGARKKEAGEAPSPDVLEEIRSMRARMGGLAAQADQLAKDAQAADLVDIARQADSLRQTVGAAHNKVGLLEKSLSESAKPKA